MAQIPVNVEISGPNPNWPSAGPEITDHFKVERTRSPTLRHPETCGDLRRELQFSHPATSSNNGEESEGTSAISRTTQAMAQVLHHTVNHVARAAIERFGDRGYQPANALQKMEHKALDAALHETEFRTPRLLRRENEVALNTLYRSAQDLCSTQILITHPDQSTAVCPLGAAIRKDPSGILADLEPLAQGLGLDGEQRQVLLKLCRHILSSREA